jgi:hypothetical protein
MLEIFNNYKTLLICLILLIYIINKISELYLRKNYNEKKILKNIDLSLINSIILT